MRALHSTLIRLVLLTLLFVLARREALAQATGLGQADSAGAAAVRVLQSDLERVVIALESGAIDLAAAEGPSGGYETASIAGYGLSGAPGAPQLPVKAFMVGVPPGAEVTLRLLDLSQAAVPGAHRIPPAPRPELEQPSRGEGDGLSAEPAGSRRVQFEEDPSVYGHDAYYPAAVVRLAQVGYIRRQRVAQVEFYPLQANPASGALLHTSRLVLELAFRYPHGRPGPGADAALAEPAAFERLLQQSLVNYESARGWRAAPRPSAGLAPASMAGPPVPGYRVSVASTAVYSMSCVDLDDVVGAAALDGLDPRTFQMFQFDAETGLYEEMAIHVEGEADGRFDAGGDYILFYGEAIGGKYAKYARENVYWLTYDPDGLTAGQRMATVDGSLNGGAVPGSFPETRHFETNGSYWALMPGADDDLSRFYWAKISAGGAVTPTATLTGIAPEQETATLRINLHGVGAGSHQVVVSVNACPNVGTLSWAGQTTYQAAVAFDQACLAEGSNSLRFAAPSPYLESRLDWFEIGYRRLYQAGGSAPLAYATEATSTGWEVWVDGFPSADVQTLDTTDPLHVAWVATPPPELNGATYRLKLGDRTGGRRFWSQAAGAWSKPIGIVADTASDLHAATNGADYVMISYAGFAAELADLATYYEATIAEPIEVMVVDVQDVYDEWSGGILYPGAIRAFLAHAFVHWDPAPAYVLLVGDGHYDYTKNLQGTNLGQYLPPYMAYVDPWQGEQATDNRYVSISGGDAWPDMAIGRFPVNSAAETAAMVAKSVGYQTSGACEGCYDSLSFVADNYTDDNFPYWCNQIADGYVPASLAVDKVYYGTKTAEWGDYTTAAAVKSAIKAAFAAGDLFIYYNGHGAVNKWAAESLFHQSDVGSLTNADRWPIMAPMTCFEGQFTLPLSIIPSLSEVLVRASGKGAVASWAPTGEGLSVHHDLLGKGFFGAVFGNPPVRRLGDATLAGKAELWDTRSCATVPAYPPDPACSLVETYVLLGDPYLEIKLPEPTAVRLAGFRAEAGPADTVVLRWETASEVDTLGFALYRAPSPAVRRARLNADLIPAAAGGAAAGASYRFVDGPLERGRSYDYWLEVVDVRGNGDLHGPVSVELRPELPGNPRVYLPLAGRGR